jgi:hypothetical protein
LSHTAQTIAEQARAENPLWGTALREQPEWEPVFSLLAPERYALGIETIYEAYLVHYGRSRLFAPAEEGERVLLGDYLYAHGLVRVAQAGGVEAVAVMADLISRCAALRAAESEPGAEGDAWVAASRSLGGDPPPSAAAAALARHRGQLEGPGGAAAHGRISA